MSIGLGSIFTEEQLEERPRQRMTGGCSFFMNNSNNLGLPSKLSILRSLCIEGVEQVMMAGPGSLKMLNTQIGK